VNFFDLSVLLLFFCDKCFVLLIWFVPFSSFRWYQWVFSALFENSFIEESCAISEKK
jgi:hypothetical protein